MTRIITQSARERIILKKKIEGVIRHCYSYRQTDDLYVIPPEGLQIFKTTVSGYD